MHHPSESFSARHTLQPNSSGDRATVVSRPLATVSALVVERNLPDALSVVSMLVSRRFHVTVAETFTKAKGLLSTQPPNVLLTEVRLGEFNGLHLVLRGKSLRPDMAAIVLSSVVDPVLQSDAEAMGATFVVKPIDESELVAAVFRTLFRARERDATDGPIRPPFERRARDRRSASERVQTERRVLERRRDLSSLLTLVASNR
jgi:two-component system response regulator RegA